MATRNMLTESIRLNRSAAIDIHHLRFLVAVEECGSLRRASNLLCVRHSALSRSITQLERLVGATLLVRSSGGAKPTLAGVRVLQVARAILEQVDVLVAIGKTNGRGEAGALSVGFCTSMSAGNLRATLIDFRKRFPEIELKTVERQRAQLENALKSGTLDVIVVTGNTSSTGTNLLKLWSERILVSLPEQHLLASRSVVYWTDLRNETVLLSHHDPSRELEDLILSKLVSVEDRPTIDRHDVSRGILKSLISMDFGVGLVTESDIGASFAGLVYRELRDGAGSSRLDFSAQWWPSNENPALKRFLHLLAERYPSPPATRGE